MKGHSPLLPRIEAAFKEWQLEDCGKDSDDSLASQAVGSGDATADVIDATEPVSAWFELTYAQFLTIPRIFLEAMPADWQRRFVASLRELDATFNWLPDEGRYWVSLRGDDGRFLPLDSNICDYRHGRIEHLRRPEVQP